MDAAALRAQYPVFESVAYLNAGTCGQMFEVRARLRAAYAGVVGGRADDVALTTATSDGMARVLGGLGLRRGDEVLTADDEHPGLYGPLAAARQQLGITVRAVPLADVADAVGPATRLVACSHVSWISGALAPAALAELPGVGAVRGVGLMNAFDLVAGGAPALVRRALLEERLVVNATGPATVRLLPPLIVTDAQLDDALARLRRLLA